VHIKITLQFQVCPMVQRVAECIGHRFGPL
jgi:hypothetical protein